MSRNTAQSTAACPFFIIIIARLLLLPWSFIPPLIATNMSRQQQQEQHPQQGTANSTLIELDDAFFGAKHEQNRQHSDVTCTDQGREELLSASLATVAAAAGGRADTDDIPMVSDVAVSESQISAEAKEDGLHDVERPATEAVRDQEAQLQRQSP
jgi:hypothetical protein